MRNEGITILQIVITIIIMIILALVAIFYGSGIPREARIVSVFNEMREIESGIKEAYILNKIKVSGDVLDFYGEITVPKVDASDYQDVLDGDASGNYYYLDFTSSRKLENVFDAENINNDYLLDYDNLNIYIIKGVEIISGESATLKYDSDDIEFYYMNVYKK